jgi:hypothetical protein
MAKKELKIKRKKTIWEKLKVIPGKSTEKDTKGGKRP